MRGRRAACDKIMDRRGERQTVATIKICFYPTRAHPFCRVEMNTYKKCVGVGVGECYPSTQRNEYIAIPGHHDPIAAGGENAFKALRDIQSHIFFCNPLTWDSAAVIAAMTRIDHYGSDRSAVSRSALCLSRGEDPQKRD